MSLRTLPFRLGLAALRAAGGVAPTRAGSAPLPGRDSEITPGALVVGKDAGPDHLTLWIGAFLLGHASATVDAQVTVTVPGEAAPRRTEVALRRFSFDEERRRSTGYRTDNSFYHRHLEVTGLPRAADVDVVVEVGGHRATCVASTLVHAPAAGDTLEISTASCYDVGTDPHGAHLDALHRRVWGARRPDLTLLTGDQVYLDAPWWFFALLARGAPRTYYLMTYWTSWGGDAAVPGLRTPLAQGPTWFLPDDHEFWNNWPHRSVTAFHSFGNIGRALRGGLARQAPAAWLRGRRELTPPGRPEQAPTDPLDQNYLPVHPDEWEGWSRGAFDLFGSFQTRSRADRADPDRIPRGEHPFPVEAGPRGWPAPLNELVQTVDLAPVRAVLLDTRTRRTRSHRHAVAQFTDPEALAALLDVAADDATDVLVLAIAQPVLRAARYPAQSTRLGRLRDHTADRGLEDYWHQYPAFWRGLVAARRGRPTVVLAGDIHRCGVSHVPALNLVEVVASPMSLVSTPWLLDAATKVTTAVAEALRGGPEPDPRVRELFAGPDGGPAPVDGEIVRGPWFDQDEEGVARLSLHREGEHGWRLDVALHRREPGDRPPSESCSFALPVPATAAVAGA